MAVKVVAVVAAKPPRARPTITYNYFAALAIAICEGPIDEVIRVWADSKVLTEDVLSASQGKYNVHFGDETQGVDVDIIAKYLPAGTIPAYRGRAYVVIEISRWQSTATASLICLRFAAR